MFWLSLPQDEKVTVNCWEENIRSRIVLWLIGMLALIAVRNTSLDARWDIVAADETGKMQQQKGLFKYLENSVHCYYQVVCTRDVVVLLLTKED